MDLALRRAVGRPAERYTPYRTCHRRFQEWVRAGAFHAVLKAIADDLEARVEIDLSKCYVDATFVIAKNGGPKVGKTMRGKGPAVVAVADSIGAGVLKHLAAASPHQISFVSATLASSHVHGTPARLIGDRAYDSDPLDAELADAGVKLIAPPRRNRTRPNREDGGKLRRYRRRWIIERLFAHLQNGRKMVVRYERYAENFLAFVQLGCSRLLLNRS